MLTWWRIEQPLLPFGFWDFGAGGTVITPNTFWLGVAKSQHCRQDTLTEGSDGDLDILMTGYTGSNYDPNVYRNEGGGSFSDMGALGLPSMNYSAAAWGDYDNDGDLDILLAGTTDSGRVSQVYRNDGEPANTVPQSPTSLSVAVGANWAELAWSPGDDAQTPASGGTSP